MPMKASDLTAKECRICHERLPLRDFYDRSGSRDGKRSECKRCIKARVKSNVAQRRDEVLEYLRQYHKTHPRQRATQQRPKYFREYRKRHRDRVRENEARWRRAHKVQETARRHARRAALPPSREAKDYMGVLLADPCSYCGRDGGTIDHIIPVASSGDNAVENLTACCLSCNSSKNDRPLLFFLATHARLEASYAL